LQAAKSFGRSLRGFQPIIRELAGVSTELKRTLEQEIGLDEIRNEWSGNGSTSSEPASTPPQPSGNPETSQVTKAESQPVPDKQPTGSSTQEPELRQVTESIAQSIDPNIEQKREQSARVAWGQEGSQHQQSAPSAKIVSTSLPSLAGLSVEELEAELAKRKASK
jgi:hypothetical protein